MVFVENNNNNNKLLNVVICVKVNDLLMVMATVDRAPVESILLIQTTMVISSVEI